VAAARDIGAAGINIEDRLPGESVLLSVPAAVERIAAAASTGVFVNARTDVYRGKDSQELTPDLVDEVLVRAQAYAGAGASGLFVPFLGDHPFIRAICEGSPIPVNVLWGPGRGTQAELAALGVARISFGHGPWAAAMAWFAEQARAVLSGRNPPYAG
jgi:2-methylisocitrate lyase-like PEP mutase family enzyme